jgi:hypothetical protein
MERKKRKRGGGELGFNVINSPAELRCARNVCGMCDEFASTNPCPPHPLKKILKYGE